MTMAISFQNIKTDQIIDDYYLRVDVKYHIFVNRSKWIVFTGNKVNNQVPLSTIIDPCFVTHVFEDDEVYKGVPTGRDYVDEDGIITNFIYVKKGNCPDRIKYAITSDNILISSIRQAATTALNFEDLSNIEDYVFSNGYYIFNVKNGYLKKFVLYLLRSKRIKNVLDNSIYRGIGISSYKLNDLLKIMVPIVDINTQRSVLGQIEPIERQILKLKQSIKSERDIINSVIIKSFNLNVDALNELVFLKHLSVGINELSEGSAELRNSVRFAKLRLIQQEMWRCYQDCTIIDDYLLPPKTKNGWSPENNELEGKTKLLGIDSIHFNGILNTDNPKYTNETRDDIDNYYIKNGDFFVSRGNTVDLVALASIAENIEEEILYPDLMIKLFIDETRINKQFLAYLFNSIIGRLYFKYASRGKQQTMVKVSSDTIRNFVVPKISIEKQKEIVAEIKKDCDAQNITRLKIQELRNRINSIFEITIMGHKDIHLSQV